jgi:hypothetical protein
MLRVDFSQREGLAKRQAVMWSRETTDPAERRARTTDPKSGIAVPIEQIGHCLGFHLNNVHLTHTITRSPLERVMRKPFPSSRTTDWPNDRALHPVRGGEGPCIRLATANANARL